VSAKYCSFISDSGYQRLTGIEIESRAKEAFSRYMRVAEDYLLRIAGERDFFLRLSQQNRCGRFLL
jgi:hypothetical protein